MLATAQEKETKETPVYKDVKEEGIAGQLLHIVLLSDLVIKVQGVSTPLHSIHPSNIPPTRPFQ